MFIYRFINIVTIYDYLPYVKEIIDRITEKKNIFTVDPSLPTDVPAASAIERYKVTAVSRSTEWIFVVYRLLAWWELIFENMKEDGETKQTLKC